jgi:hypothetical protein
MDKVHKPSDSECYTPSSDSLDSTWHIIFPLSGYLILMSVGAECPTWGFPQDRQTNVLHIWPSSLFVIIFNIIRRFTAHAVDTVSLNVTKWNFVMILHGQLLSVLRMQRSFPCISALPKWDLSLDKSLPCKVPHSRLILFV